MECDLSHFAGWVSIADRGAMPIEATRDLDHSHAKLFRLERGSRLEYFWSDAVDTGRD
jgi:hypothetical protein